MEDKQQQKKSFVCLLVVFFIHLLPSSAGDETAIITWSTESKKGLIKDLVRRLNVHNFVVKPLAIKLEP